MKLIILAGILVFMSSFVQAQTQKIAYIESESIVPNMPAYKQAQSELQSYTKQLERTLEQKKAKLEKDYVSVMDSVQKGIMTPARQKKAEVRLQTGQQQLQQEAMSAEKKVSKKEGQLIEPLYIKFEKAIKAVAKEQGYTYILDKKFMLYSVGGIDATAQVKAKLGI